MSKLDGYFLLLKSLIASIKLGIVKTKPTI